MKIRILNFDWKYNKVIIIITIIIITDYIL
jgi:hypothetical protein